MADNMHAGSPEKVRHGRERGKNKTNTALTSHKGQASPPRKVNVHALFTLSKTTGNGQQ